MERSQKESLCCGGGDGNFFTDILGGGEESPARLRVREALDTGAGIIAVACPQCAKMLEDAVKALDLDEQLEVMDVASLLVFNSPAVEQVSDPGDGGDSVPVVGD